jgi:hypothetical protein
LVPTTLQLPCSLLHPLVTVPRQNFVNRAAFSIDHSNGSQVKLTTPSHRSTSSMPENISSKRQTLLVNAQIYTIHTPSSIHFKGCVLSPGEPTLWRAISVINPRTTAPYFSQHRPPSCVIYAHAPLRPGCRTLRLDGAVSGYRAFGCLAYNPLG